MRIDGLLLCAVGALVALGAVVQARLSGSAPGADLLLPFAVGAAAGAVAAFACANGRAGRFLRGRGAWLAWGVAVLLMAALLVFGRRYRGGLYLPGRMNPAEIVKLAVVAWSAGMFLRGGAKEKRVFAGARDLLAFAGGFGVVAAEITCAGDFGLLAQLALIVAAMLFAASWKWGAVAFAAIGAGIAGASACATGHLATRFAVWRDPLADMTGSGWQTLQGLTAVVSGGLSGRGFGLGDVERVPIVSSDFVYAALAEELGVLGCAVVLALLGTLVLRGLAVAARRAAADDPNEALLAAGIAAGVAVQTILNVGGVLNALPMTGIPLPFVSRGGSSLATMLAMCGVLLGLAATSVQSAATPAKRRGKGNRRLPAGS